MYGGYKYEVADEACDNLSYAIDYMNEAMDGDIKKNLLKTIEHSESGPWESHPRRVLRRFRRKVSLSRICFRERKPKSQK